MSQLQTNLINLQEILDSVNNLPEVGENTASIPMVTLRIADDSIGFRIACCIVYDGYIDVRDFDVSAGDSIEIVRGTPIHIIIDGTPGYIYGDCMFDPYIYDLSDINETHFYVPLALDATDYTIGAGI